MLYFSLIQRLPNACTQYRHDKNSFLLSLSLPLSLSNLIPHTQHTHVAHCFGVATLECFSFLPAINLWVYCTPCPASLRVFLLYIRILFDPCDLSWTFSPMLVLIIQQIYTCTCIEIQVDISGTLGRMAATTAARGGQAGGLVWTLRAACVCCSCV